MLCLAAQMKKSNAYELDFMCIGDKKDIFESLRMDLNSCQNKDLLSFIYFMMFSNPSSNDKSDLF